MNEILESSIARIAAALRRRDVSSRELVEAAIERHAARGEALNAYKCFDAEGARLAAVRADRMLDSGNAPAPLCGIPVSVKDLYGVARLPTFAGTARELPGKWTREGWLVSALRRQGAVIVGKTHTVELAYGGVGFNPHWGTPWNPWDAKLHRIPGGSSSGAGVSLWEGSALLALGTDTGGSIRIPASMTGTVGHKTTYGRWSADGVVPLSYTLDSVGALARSVADSAYFFGAVDPAWGDPDALLGQLESARASGLVIGVPRCDVWRSCQSDVADAIHAALDALARRGAKLAEVEGGLFDEAFDLYRTGSIAAAECVAFLSRELPEWFEFLHPTVGKRIEGAASLDSDEYRTALARRIRMIGRVSELFEGVDVLALPGALVTPPPVDHLGDVARYLAANSATLRPTSPVSLLDLCAVTLPVGRDHAGMPVGLQLVARRGQDERVLEAALVVEREAEPLGDPPSMP